MSTPAATTASSDLWRWSATALLDAIRRGEVSVTEVVSAHLDRAAVVNPSVNALVEVSADEALDSARALDAASPQSRTGLLHGVPTVVKDNTDQAGHRNTNGIAAAAGNVAAQDASVVAAMRAHGAVFVGRSNLPAFGLRWFSENDLFGRTLNPWTKDRTPGGSSGGAAAAVATGMVPVAHANDIGGSIRYPAAMCGVTGIRPTVGRVPKWAAPSPVNLAPSLAETVMAVEGPIARHVSDLRVALEAMSRYDPRDPASLPVPYRDEPPLGAGARVTVVREVPGVQTCAAALDAIEKAAGWLKEAGYEIVEHDVPEIAEAHRLWQLLLFEELRPATAEFAARGGEQLHESLLNSFAIAEPVWGPAPTLEDFMHGYTRRNELLSRLETRFLDAPLLLTPASAALAPLHGADHGPVDAAKALMDAQWPMTFVPCLGLPGATVPTGIVDGLPTSVQLVGGRFRESWILDAAQAIEDRAGVITPIDPFPTS
ncbi:amidase [Kineosporia sp. R_H_3]|uniref:amidase n=1 Tax=Kineosporia sp. R_H_3 TaxID=1961848 RepID=UPI000B4B55E9|nr:amidase [Kineosporia sp. R_H_3]